jgi:hypothetical protein
MVSTLEGCIKAQVLPQHSIPSQCPRALGEACPFGLPPLSACTDCSSIGIATNPATNAATTATKITTITVFVWLILSIHLLASLAAAASSAAMMMTMVTVVVVMMMSVVMTVMMMVVGTLWTTSWSSIGFSDCYY